MAHSEERATQEEEEEEAEGGRARQRVSKRSANSGRRRKASTVSRIGRWTDVRSRAAIYPWPRGEVLSFLGWRGGWVGDEWEEETRRVARRAGESTERVCTQPLHGEEDAESKVRADTPPW